MRLVSIIGFLNELDSVASACSSLGAFEPDNVDLFFKDADKFSNFSGSDTSLSLMEELNGISEQMGKKIDKNSSPCVLNKKQISKYVSGLSEKCKKTYLKLNNLKAQLEINNEIINNLRPFEDIEQKISEFQNCEYLKVKFIKISENNLGRIRSTENAEDKFLISEVNAQGDFKYCIVFISEEFYSEFLDISSKIQFTEFKFSNLSLTPKEEAEKLIEKNKLISESIKKLEDGLEKFWEYQKNSCSGVYNKLKMYEKNEEIKKYAKVYNDNFVIVGWVPLVFVSSLTDKLKKISRVEYSVESGEEILEFSPPTKLKNNKIFSPFEFFVSTYGLPKYSDIDPTTFVAITYTIIFGIMFADVGQGLILFLIGMFLYKIKNIKVGGVIATCGISSSIFGFVVGSIFGFEELLTPFYNAIKLHPIRVMESPMTIISSSIAIGVISLVLAMCINIYANIRRGDIKEAILSHSGLCGILLYLSLISMLIGTLSGKSMTSIPMITVSSCAVLIFLKEAIKKNFKIDWKDYVLTQFFEMFDIFLGYFTNTISFIRIGVFIFVHAGMMMVVFSLAEGFSPIGYAITVIIGNLFVTCFEAFLVGMQVMRLQFCELFGRFFEGGGRAFKPITSTDS